MGRRVVAVLGVAVAGWAGACSLTPLDALSGGASDPPDARADAHADTPADAHTDAPADASPRDASPILDAARADAAGGADATTGCYVADGLSPADDERADGQSYEMGTHMQVTVPVTAKKMRFWRAPSEPGIARVGSLWSAQKTRLASAQLPAVLTAGWVEGVLEPPVPLVPGKDYVVSVGVSSFYVSTSSALTNDMLCPTGKLFAPRSTPAAPNGVFGAPGAFPDKTFDNSFYFVDLYVE